MASESDTPKQNPANTVSEGNRSEKKDNKIPPILRTETQMPPANADSNDTRQNRQYRLDRKRFWVEVVTSLAVIFYGCIAYFQWHEMRKSTDAAKKSAEVAERAATIAEKTLKFTEESFQSDQRAWVGAVEVAKLDIKPGSTIVEVRFVNTGKTPALQFMVVVSGKYQPTTDKFIPEYPKLKTNPEITAIQPQMRVSSGPPGILLSQQQIDRIREGTSTYYVYGKFTYRTVSKKEGGGTFCMYIRNRLDAVSWCDTYNQTYY